MLVDGTAGMNACGSLDRGWLRVAANTSQRQVRIILPIVFCEPDVCQFVFYVSLKSGQRGQGSRVAVNSYPKHPGPVQIWKRTAVGPPHPKTQAERCVTAYGPRERL